MRSEAAGNVALGLSTGWAGPSGPALAILFFFFFPDSVLFITVQIHKVLMK